MGGYRARTSSWFGGNLSAALSAVIERSPQAIYLSREIPYADAYWRFAAIAEQRPDLIDRVGYVDGATLPDAPAGALLVCAADSAVVSRGTIVAGVDACGDVRRA